MLIWRPWVWSRLLHGLFERAKRPGIYGRHRVRPKQVWVPVYAVWGLSLVPPDRRSRLSRERSNISNEPSRYHRDNAQLAKSSVVQLSPTRRQQSRSGGGAWTLLIRSFVRHFFFGKILPGEVFSLKISQRLRATFLFLPIPGRRKSRPTTDADGSTARSQVIRESKIKRHVRPTFSPVFVYARSVSNPRSARAKQQRDAPNRISYKIRNEYSR